MAQRKLQIYLSDAQYDALRRMAGAGRSMAAVVRDLIEASGRPADPGRDPFYRHVLAERRGSGRSYDAAEAKRRLHGRPKGPGA